jgi:hypothetical protein
VYYFAQDTADSMATNNHIKNIAIIGVSGYVP